MSDSVNHLVENLDALVQLVYVIIFMAVLSNLVLSIIEGISTLILTRKALRRMRDTEESEQAEDK